MTTRKYKSQRLLRHALCTLYLVLCTCTSVWGTDYVLYQKTASNWTAGDLAEWTGSPVGTGIVLDGGNLKTSGGNASYEYKKALDVHGNATLAITATWNTGSSIGRSGGYNYLAFGDIELRAYGQDSRGVIVIGENEYVLTTTTNDVRNNAEWTITLNVNQVTGAVTYSVTLPNAGVQAGSGTVSDLNFTAIEMGYYKAGQVGSTYQTLKAVSVTQTLYAYTIQKSVNGVVTTITTGDDGPGATISYPYKHYELVETTLYEAARQSNPYFIKSFVLSSDGQVETMTYNASTKSNVFVYREAEDFMPPITANNYINIRCSDAKAGYSRDFVKATPLSPGPGVYRITMATYDNQRETYTFKAGATEWSHLGTAGWGEIRSENIQLPMGGNDFLAKGGSSSYAMDYYFVEGVFVFFPQHGDLTYNTTQNISSLLINNLAANGVDMTGKTIRYVSENKGVVQVANVADSQNGVITAVHNGTATIRALVLTDAQATEFDNHYGAWNHETYYTYDEYAVYTVTVKGEPQQTGIFTYDSSTKTETYTVPTTQCALPQTAQAATGSTISISFGNTSETQFVKSVNGEWAASCIDTNNAPQALVGGGALPTMGTYYTFVPSVNGTLTIHALLNPANQIRLVDADGNILERINVGAGANEVEANTWKNYTFATLLTAGATYYVYAQTSWMTDGNGSSVPTLYLKSFTFTQMEGTTISLIDQSLLLFPEKGGNTQRFDRTIPGFEVKFGGDDSGCSYRGGQFLLKNNIASSESGNGWIKLIPRIASGSADGVTITSVTLNIGGVATSGTTLNVGGVNPGSLQANSSVNVVLPANTHELEIKLTGTGTKDLYQIAINSITVVYNTVGTTLNMSKGDVTLVAPDYVYGYEGEKEAADIYYNSPSSFYGDLNISITGEGFANGCTNSVTKHEGSGKKTHFNDGDTNTPYQVLIGNGVGSLNAEFVSTKYFNGATATTRLYSRDYEESPAKVLATNDTYTWPAGNGMTFEITAAENGTITLNGGANITMTAGETYTYTVVSGEDKVVVKNTGGSAITISKIKVYRKSATLSFSYDGAVGGDRDVLFVGEDYLPTDYSVAGSEVDIESHYRGAGAELTYEIVTPVNGVSVNAATGQLTVNSYADQGFLDVRLTVTPNTVSKSSYQPLSSVIRLRVNNGMWDFRSYRQANHRSIWGRTESDEAKAANPGIEWDGTVNGYTLSRDNDYFDYILMNQANGSNPLPHAFSLQTRYHHRLVWVKDYGDGYLHLRGRGIGTFASRHETGGEVRIPVKAGMLVEVNANADDLLAEMEIDNVTDLDDQDVKYFYVNSGLAQSQYFIAKSDGYVIVRNPSISLELFIRYIRVTAEMVFKYGHETYVEKTAGTWANPVMNQGTTTLSHVYSNTSSSPVSAINSETGEVTLADTYGVFTVTATGSGTGLLAGKTGTYTANVVSMAVTDQSQNVSTSSVSFNLRDRITVIGTSGSVDDALKDQVVFSLVNPVPSVTLSGSTLKVDGVQSVEVKATLGSIEKTFTCSVTGGLLSFSVNGGTPVTGTNIVIPNTTNTLTITVEGAGVTRYSSYPYNDAVYFDRDYMRDHAIGDIKGQTSTYTYSEYYSPLVIEFNLAAGEKLPGGVIPIIGKYSFNGNDYDIVGTITIPYESHVWRFQHNLLTGMDATAEDTEEAAGDLADDALTGYGSSHGLVGGISGWTTAAAGSKTAAWNSTYATIDEPTDAGTRSDTYNWKFVRKISGHLDSPIIYYYNHSVEGQNALVVPETEGLHINSRAVDRQFGVELMRKEPLAPYDCRNLMLLRGGKIIIPKVKPGQWIEVRWTRHKEDEAERVLLKNLCDVNGTYISDVYKIGNCFYNLPWSTSTYMFQVAPEGTSRGDGTFVTLDADGCVNVEFEIADNTYISIQQIELHEPGWDYLSSMIYQLNGYEDNNNMTDEQLATAKAGWTKTTAPTLSWHHIWDDGNAHSITFLPKDLQNAPNAPQEWDFELDPTFTGAQLTYDKGMIEEAKLYYTDGWGKVKVKLTSYSQNLKYVANHKEWTITFGQGPRQTYPYTWDFTKYFSATHDNIGTDSWTTSSSVMTAKYDNYDTNIYTSYFVDGAQLVSYKLWEETSNGILPETNGLGFKLVGGTATLSLDMQSTVSSAAKASSNATWKDGCLNISAGGKIIVPKPGTGFTNFYVYVLADVEPSVNGSVLEKQSTDVSESGTKKQFRYHFLQNANAELTFASDAAVYAIGVTDQLKTMKPLSGTGWATESRNVAIDHTLTGYLTTNPVSAYAVIEKGGNPTYSNDKSKTTVKIEDQCYVAPNNTGLVLKQTTSVPGSDYMVPLFVPAVTTATDEASTFTDNLMRPNVNETTFDSETETFKGENYTRFILTNRYMTWKKEGSNAATYSNFETGEHAAFYRMHLYGDSSFDGGTNRNTLGANKAYLLLKTDLINPALWDTSSPAKPRYVGIEGESDMEEITDSTEYKVRSSKVYNTQGQVMDETAPLLPGVYIKNGRKFLVK